MVKILCVGNSFSQDATSYLTKMTEGLFVRNLYIGGCSLETHANNLVNNLSYYEYQENGDAYDWNKSANDMIKSEKWDYITIQQASHDSGMFSSYYPYILTVIEKIKELCPTAKIIFHQTWAYSVHSTHPAFPRYDSNQIKMFEAIKECTHKVSEDLNLPLIKCGEVIQALRGMNEFKDIRFTRDGFHMSFEYGRYAIGYVWAKFFNAKVNDFLPENSDPNIIKLIREKIDEMNL